MNKNYKYIGNMGLAFDEDRVLKKMSSLAKEGWILKEMTVFKYKLERGEAKELIYSMDYRELKGNTEEYFELFNSSGWRHMCSYGPYHFFSAPNGTVPIYTDRENYLGKYKASRSIYLRMLIISTISLLTAILLDLLIVDKLNNIVFDVALFLVGAISALIMAPSFMVTVAYIFRFKEQKLKE